MAVGDTTTGSLADSLDTIVASASSRREYDGVVPQLVDRVDLDKNTGLSWKETLFEALTPMAITGTRTKGAAFFAASIYKISAKEKSK